jgi:hypothetical protein
MFTEEFGLKSGVASYVSRWRFEGFFCSGFVIAVLLPYLSPVPISGMDVQPLAMALAPLVVGLRFIRPDRAFLMRSEVALVLVGLTSLIYFRPGAFEGFSDYFRVCAPLAIGAMMVVALVHALPRTSPLVTVFVAAAYCAGVLLQLLSPSTYDATVAPLLSEVRFQGDSIRGPNGLAVEPSMVGNICAILIAIPALFRPQWWANRRWAVWLLRFFCVLAVLLTGSVTGVASCVLVGSLLAVSASRRPILALASLIGGLITLAIIVSRYFEIEGRIGDLIAGISESPFWLLTELSVVMRYVNWLVALTYLAVAPLGDGVGTLDAAIAGPALAYWAEVLNWSGYYVDTLWTHVIDTSVGIGSLIIRMGFIGVFCLLTVLWITSRGRGGLIRFVLLGTTLLNVSLATPFVWMILALGLLVGRADLHTQRGHQLPAASDWASVRSR